MVPRLPAHLVPLFVIGSALWTAACAPHSSIYADRSSAEVHEVEVYAADRVSIDHQTITLADAETPQPRPHASCRAEDMIAAQAADVVRTTLSSARHIEVRPTGGADGLGLVNVDGLDLGQTLIRQGLAVSRGPVAMDWCLRSRASG